MIYRNDTDAALYACERARTGDYGNDSGCGMTSNRLVASILRSRGYDTYKRESKEDDNNE